MLITINLNNNNQIEEKIKELRHLYKARNKQKNFNKKYNNRFYTLNLIKIGINYKNYSSINNINWYNIPEEIYNTHTYNTTMKFLKDRLNRNQELNQELQILITGVNSE